MAKMFYTLDETKAALGKNEEEIKQFTREGKLREFRDGPRLMFKADQVEALKGQVGTEGVNLTGASDSGMPIGLADSKGGSAPGISLGDISGSGLGSGVGSASAGSGMMNLKDDTALAADLGLSGSMGGVPSPGRTSPSGTGLSGTAGGTRAGINVFGDEPGDRVDPMAQTSVSPGMGGSHADLSLDAVGSGSGLLDLTRESDDTSLGSVLDELGPGARKGDTGAGMAAPEVDDLPEPRGGVVRGLAPVTMERPDPLAPMLGGAAAGAAVFVLFGIFALMAAVSGTHPQMVKDVGLTWGQNNMWYVVGMGLLLSVIGGVIGMVLGKIAR